MDKKSVGIIGVSGKMGRLLTCALDEAGYTLGPSCNSRGIFWPRGRNPGVRPHGLSHCCGNRDDKSGSDSDESRDNSTKSALLNSDSSQTDEFFANTFSNGCKPPLGHHDKEVPGIFQAMEVKEALEIVFQDNAWVIDFSSPDLESMVFQAFFKCPKALILGCARSTISLDQWRQASEKKDGAPILVAPNTSIFSYAQEMVTLFLDFWLARIYPASYDIDILDRHHREKKDAPSGTAQSMLFRLGQQRQYQRDEVQNNAYSPRGHIEVQVQRSGHCPGTHSVLFSGQHESLEVNHSAFQRDVYVKSVPFLMAWLSQHLENPALYTMGDVFTWPNFFHERQRTHLPETN